MIQKVVLSGVQAAKNIAMHSRQSIVLNNTLNKEFHSVNKSFKYAKVKRFFTEFKAETKSLLRKFFKKNELKKTHKKSIVKYSEEEMERNRKRIEEERLVVKKRVEYIKKDIESKGYTFERGDVDESGFPTTQGKRKLDNIAFKGHQDDLDFEDAIGKKLSHEQDTQLHELDISDTYNEEIMGRHSAKTIEPGESSLNEAMSHNQEQSHNLEHGHNLSETMSSLSDDLADELFG